MDNQFDEFSGNPTPAPPGLSVTNSIKNYWSESRKWALFMAILGFIYLGFIVLLLLAGGRAGALIGLFGFSIIGVLVFIPVWFVFQFSQKMKTALAQENTPDLEESFANLRRLYLFTGILTIIFLGFYLIMLMFVFSFAAGQMQ